ncbi:hypothetical protein [Acinetobacter sp. YH16055]|uniref:hypothetical protein n=1 Tax=Acinetobacter sp. YH16055 TaxID=2601193 RepID=UPI0015D1BF5A|nr:hypothetical protein [Acinetobacter sp. YH16055]
MVASTDIKYFTFENLNAPQLQNAYGSMIDVLDACLVNGISIGVVSSLTSVGTTVTATFSTAHKLLQYQVLKISGANQAEYNGEYRILTVPNATSVTFELGSTPSVTTASGVITASLPPLGWEKPFSSVNAAGGGKAAYRSQNMLLPSRPFLRVVDELDPAYVATYAKYAKVGIVEDMSDIDTMLGVQAPFDLAVPDKNWVGTTGSAPTNTFNGWSKWYYANISISGITVDSIAAASGPRQWTLIGNGDWFYILPATTPNNDLAFIYGFGAFNSLLNVDASATFLGSTLFYSQAGASYNKGFYTGLGTPMGTAKCLIQRKYTQEATYVESSQLSLAATSFLGSGQSDNFGAASLANTVNFAPVFLSEMVLRGELPSIRWLFHRQPYLNRQAFENSGSIFISVHTYSYSASGAVVFELGNI